MLWPLLAPAQYISMYGPQSTPAAAAYANLQYLMNTSALRQMLERAAQQRSASAPASPQPGPAAAAPSRRPPGDFTFPYQGRLLSMHEMAAIFTNDPGAQAQLAREFGQLVQTVAEDLGRGGSPYDLAKAFTLFTTTMYAVLNPGAPITERTMDRLRLQFRSELLDDSVIRRPAPEVQKHWETLVAISGWTLMTYQLAVQKQNHSLAATLRDNAANALRIVFQAEPQRIRIDSGADWPLTILPGPPASAGGGWGQPAPSAAASAPQKSSGWGQPAPPATAGMQQGSSGWGAQPAATAGMQQGSSGWGAQPAAFPSAPSPALAAGGTVRVGHHHFLTGMHPAVLHLGDSELVFDPSGHSCNQTRINAPYSAVQVRDPAPNSSGELLLNIRMPDPRNPKKTVNLNFVSEDSWIDESSGAPYVRSPAGAMDRLRDLAAELRRRGAR
jgi:hypothetical protein